MPSGLVILWSRGSQDAFGGARNHAAVAITGPVAVLPLSSSHASPSPLFRPAGGWSVVSPAFPSTPSSPPVVRPDPQGPLGQRLSVEHLGRLAPFGRRLDLPKGRVVLRQGNAPSEFYILLSGEVEHRRRLKDRRELILGRSVAGEHFGEISLIDGDRQMVSVHCVSPCRLLAFSGDKFSLLVASDPVFAMAVIGGLVERARLVRRRQADLALKDVPERVLTCLGELAEIADDGCRRVSPAPSHAQIAKLIGSARASVTRTLGRLQQAGRIQIEPQAIVLV